MVDFMLQRQSWVAATETKRHKKPEIFTIWPFIRKNMPISGLDKLYRRFEGWVVGSMGFPGSSAGKESACNVGDPGSIPGSGKSPGEGIGYPLQYSCLENLCGQRTLEGYSPWGGKELDMTEWLTLYFLKLNKILSSFQLPSFPSFSSFCFPSSTPS